MVLAAAPAGELEPAERRAAALAAERIVWSLLPAAVVATSPAAARSILSAAATGPACRRATGAQLSATTGNAAGRSLRPVCPASGAGACVGGHEGPLTVFVVAVVEAQRGVV